MALSNLQSSLVRTPSEVVPAVSATTIVLSAIAVNTHPSEPVFIDVLKRNSTSDLYICFNCQLPANNRLPVALPFEKLVLEAGESIQARAYGPEQLEWDTTDWDSFNWDLLIFTPTSSSADLLINISV